MKKPKTLALFSEDLKKESVQKCFQEISLGDFSCDMKGYSLIIFFDLREESPIIYSTKVLKNSLITSLVKL